MAQGVPENLPALMEVSKMLLTLGVGLNYLGYNQTIQAVDLALQDPESLELIYKRIFWAIGKRQYTTTGGIERNIHRASRIAYETNRKYLEELAGEPLSRVPTATQFVAILTKCVSPVQCESE